MFLLITFALSTIFYVLIGTAGTVEAAGGLYILGLMWCPGVAAILTRLLRQGNLRGMGWSWGQTRYQLLSYALPFLLTVVTYVPVWLTGLGRFPNMAFVEQIAGRMGLSAAAPALVILAHVLIVGTMGVATGAASALGEEIGWRGYLVPQLAKTTDFTRNALISGVIWAVWHFPGIIFADYNSGTPTWYALICFTILIMGFSFILAWVRLKSGSVWTAMFLHASYNAFVQSAFTPLTADTGPTEYLITEFGAVMAVVYVVTAYIFWRKRDQLPDNGA